MVFLHAVWLLLAIHPEYTYEQTIWNMHDICGTVISRADLIGELHFDSEQLPTNLPDDSCKVTITPLKLDNEAGMVLFYFTTFNFKDYCKKTNVSVIDGGSNNDNIVNGLPRYLCGVNTTIERTDQFFSSSGTSLKIIYNTNNDGVAKPGIFVMKFVSYNTGSCSDTDVHACSNGHCVPNEYACSDDFNVCGDIDSNCAADTTSESNTSVFETVITVLFVTAFFGFTIFGFCMVCRHSDGSSRCLGEVCECLCEIPGRCCGGIADICSKCGGCTRQKCSSCCGSINAFKTSCADQCTECCGGIADTCTNFCRCARQKCSICGNSIIDVKTSCGDHSTECCRSIRNKCATCGCCKETTNQDNSNRTDSDATVNPNIVASQPTSLQRNSAPDVVANDSTSSSSESELEDSDIRPSNDRITPSAPAMYSLSVEDPPPSYDEAVAPSYDDYIANKKRYEKQKHRGKH